MSTQLNQISSIKLFRFTTGEGLEYMLNKTVARHIQVPLGLAWALTIHKSQSQTLNKVIVDLHKCLQIARSKEGLEICHFNSSKVFINKALYDWYLQTFKSRHINGSQFKHASPYNSTSIIMPMAGV
ncbi:uncharacterized protein HD556DRAFT_1309628 [Suillus plorans]|uniref:ATP-dependent DNA helicase n=1 Tax=Suillus plorans TaxID=116603 RepID=A0A9P7DFI4_9AGAM|nr:uncharacterized protein HD556DRAFT_1309628 [Suillus plorans]KAG1792083.1 hypothetical protein HD556DRAFT_1309628 [Suillus plorans]